MTDRLSPGARRRMRVGPVLGGLALLLVLVLVLVPGGPGGNEWWPWPGTAPLAADWAGATRVLAGDGTPAARDGRALDARFSEPFGLAVGPDGTLFIADAGDHHAIRVLSPDGTLFTLAGGTRGFADGRGADARFDTPSGVALTASGSLLVADTANNAIREVSPDGHVRTIAGGGPPGFADGPAATARFNGPIGVTVDPDGRIVVADSYNDRIRIITPDGQVTTLAGGARGFADGPGAGARFDTPAGIAVMPDGTLLVADTGNNLLRGIDSSGHVTTPDGLPSLSRPTGITAGRDDAIYVTDERGRIIAIDLAPRTDEDEADRPRARTIAGARPGFREGIGAEAEFRRPSGIAVRAPGELIVADTGNALVRLVAEPSRLGMRPPASPRIQPAFDLDAFRAVPLLWPVAPLDGPHEIAGTLGEARGEGAERLHAGIDVRMDQGVRVHAVRDGVVESPLAAGSFGTLNEWMRIGPIAYIHVRVGRARGDRLYDLVRFVPNYDERGRLAGIRVKRGARFVTGETIASVNAFNHVHLNVGWPGEEFNPLHLRMPNFVDTIPPTINAVRLYRAGGEPLTTWSGNRLSVSGEVQIVVDAWDMAEGNRPGRRLGLYSLGYQVLYPDGTPVHGFEERADTVRFTRLAGDRTAANLIFAPGSGIPFYSGGRTRFLYTVTNTLRDGIATEGYWDTTRLAPGDYTLRVWGADIAGNTTTRDVPVTINP
jgi:sugar lactone lactonase YvrE